MELHPVSCAVALKTLEIYERDNILAHTNTVSPTFQQRLNKCLDHKLVGHTRGVGLIGAMEFVSQQDSNKLIPTKRESWKIIYGSC